MLSDSLFEACEAIWYAVENYTYSEEYKDELVVALTKLGYIVYKLDRLQNDCIWTEEDYKNEYVLKHWGKRRAKRNRSESD